MALVQPPTQLGPAATVANFNQQLPGIKKTSSAAPASLLPLKLVNGGLKTRRFKKKRLMSRKYCKKTPCRRMGFTQKASCRPYKNCYTRRK